MDVKQLVEYNFSILCKKYKKLDVFKFRAYNKALNQLKTVESITTMKDVEGVGGAKTQDKIKKIIETKTNIPEVDEYLSNDDYTIVDDLQKIHGIGPSKAKELFEKHNIKSIDDLKNKKELLNNVQLMGLEYYDHIEKKIPYKEMVKHEDFITSSIKDIVDTYSIAGSYRRKAFESSDIDLLISGNTNLLDKVVELFSKNKYINSKAILAKGSVKFMGLCKLPRHKTYRRIDILYTNPEEYPFALLYFTGNYKFNVDMRKHALTKGYTLNEQGLYNLEDKSSVKHEFTTEEDIFEFLDYPYIEPTKRSV